MHCFTQSLYVGAKVQLSYSAQCDPKLLSCCRKQKKHVQKTSDRDKQREAIGCETKCFSYLNKPCAPCSSHGRFESCRWPA